MDSLFTIELYGKIFSIYIRELFMLEINVFLVFAVAAIIIAVKFYRYRKNTIRLEPLLGVVNPRKNK